MRRRCSRFAHALETVWLLPGSKNEQKVTPREQPVAEDGAERDGEGELREEISSRLDFGCAGERGEHLGERSEFGEGNVRA
jgi:hypothetical protein